MENKVIHAVTGAYGYSGAYIARRLLEKGVPVVTLTNSPGRGADLRDRVPARPLCFGDQVRLVEQLRDVKVLINTYWVRFNDKGFTHQEAVSNTLALFEAARLAGVQRIVHVSITNPREGCGLEYFEGKALLEATLAQSGIPHSILRPAVLFGGEDILINNIAWTVRRFPFVAVFGDGQYRLQPIHVDDLAALAVAEAAAAGNRLVQAIGPETYTYDELLRMVAHCLDKRTRLLHCPPWLAFACGKLVGWWQCDRFVTWEEVKGLMGDYLCVQATPTGTTRLSSWVAAHAHEIGRIYASELARRRNRGLDYRETQVLAPRQNSLRRP